MLPAKHTAGLASCKYLIVLHCTAKCAQLRVCIVAVKYGIWLHWKRCIVCVWGRQKVFHNCLWQATGHRPWSFGRLNFHCFMCQALCEIFSPNRLNTFEVDKNNYCKEKKFWACPLKRTKINILTLSRHYTEEQYQIAALFHCWGSFQVCKDCNITLSRAIAPRKRIASQY